MASLFVTTNNARKVLLVILGIAAAIVLLDTFGKVKDIIGTGGTPERRFYLDPNNALGSVAAPNIPGLKIDISNASIVQTSALSGFPDVAYVYQIEKPREKLNTASGADGVATKLGFTAVGFKDMGNNDYQWTGSDGSKILKFNKVSQIWSLTTNYSTNVEAKKKKTLGADIQAYSNRITSVLNTLTFSSSLGMDAPKVDARYIVRSDQGDIKQTTDSKAANYIKINAYRKLFLADLKDSKDQPKLNAGEVKPQTFSGYVYKTDPRVGEFSAVVSNDLTSLPRDIFEFNFTNYEYGNKGIYSIVKLEEAFSRVQRGQGSLVALTPENTDYFASYDNISVSRFIVDFSRSELGYYQPDEWTGFVYPIYILTGRAELTDGRQANFTFYVDAIKRLNS